LNEGGKVNTNSDACGQFAIKDDINDPLCRMLKDICYLWQILCKSV